MARLPGRSGSGRLVDGEESGPVAGLVFKTSRDGAHAVWWVRLPLLSATNFEKSSENRKNVFIYRSVVGRNYICAAMIAQI